MPAAPSHPSFDVVSHNKRASLRKTVQEQKNATHVGIEIEIDRVRLTSITRYHPDLERFENLGRFEYEIPSIGRINTQTPESIAHAIERVCDRLPRCTDARKAIAAVGLSMDWFRMQTVSGHEIDAIKEQLTNQFSRQGFPGMPSLAFWPVVGEHHGTPNLDDQYVVFAIPADTIGMIADGIASQGYHIRSIIPTPVVLAKSSLRMTGIDSQCVVWVDSTTAWISVIHRSGVGMVRRLPTPEFVPFQGRQQSLETTSFSSLTNTSLSALGPYLRDLSESISETIDYASRADMSKPSNRPVLIAGPLAEIPGFENELASNLELPVAVWSTIRSSKEASTPAGTSGRNSEVLKDDCRFATALSLSRFAAIANPAGRTA
ncbi:MAG: hypothetical protein AAF802_03270 [Planctomycetota bacterium]